mmetsp:Transcript_29436/g.94258  ORF Transcript_29436/g.94258 Transcript_29436/m.94258 type:complete len:202 (-) Transcript_29436:3109-3714(-)
MSAIVLPELAQLPSISGLTVRASSHPGPPSPGFPAAAPPSLGSKKSTDDRAWGASSSETRSESLAVARPPLRSLKVVRAPRPPALAAASSPRPPGPPGAPALGRRAAASRVEDCSMASSRLRVLRLRLLNARFFAPPLAALHSEWEPAPRSFLKGESPLTFPLAACHIEGAPLPSPAGGAAKPSSGAITRASIWWMERSLK